MTSVNKPERRQEPKTWVKTTHRPGGTFVTVTLVEGHFTAKWTTKTYATQIEAGLREAYGHAERVLAEQQKAFGALMTELDQKRQGKVA